MGSPLLGIVRLTLFLLWVLLIAPAQSLSLALRLPLRWKLPMLFHRGCLRIFGIEVRMIGHPSPVKPTLFICNHVSYLDIEVLGSLITGSFIAKSEVEGWPLFGWLARLQETVFINRKARNLVARQSETLGGRLLAGCPAVGRDGCNWRGGCAALSGGSPAPNSSRCWCSFRSSKRYMERNLWSECTCGVPHLCASWAAIRIRGSS